MFHFRCRTVANFGRAIVPNRRAGLPCDHAGGHRQREGSGRRHLHFHIRMNAEGGENHYKHRNAQHAATHPELPRNQTTGNPRDKKHSQVGKEGKFVHSIPRGFPACLVKGPDPDPPRRFGRKLVLS